MFGFSKLLVAALPVFLLAWFRFPGLRRWRWRTGCRAGADEAPLDARLSRWLVFLESFSATSSSRSACCFGMREGDRHFGPGVIMVGIPATVALLSWLFLRETLSARMLGAIALAVAGVVLTLSPVAARRMGTRPRLGCFAVRRGLLRASYVVIGKRLAANSPKRIQRTDQPVGAAAGDADGRGRHGRSTLVRSRRAPGLASCSTRRLPTCGRCGYG